MKKEILAVLLCMALVLSFSPVTAFADDEAGGDCGHNLTWTMDEDTLIISGEGDMYDFERDSLPWRDCLPWIKEIIIEDGVTHIGNYAFNDTWNVTDVTIPDGMRSIGRDAFGNCDSLGSITIPDKVTSIGERAFEYCLSLTSVTIGKDIGNIDSGAFAFCCSLTDMTFLGHAPNFGESVFENDGAVTVRHPCSDMTWTDKKYEFYGAAMMWVITHTEEVDRERMEPTCGEAGHEKVSHCALCEKILSNGGTITATGNHTEVVDMAKKEPTCVEDGHEKVSHCSVCDKILSRGNLIPATGVHTEVVDKSVKATSTTTGLTEGSHCKVCGKVIKKQTLTLAKPVLTTGTKNIATRKIVVKWKKNSTCTGYQVKYVTGSTTKTVKVSGRSTLSKTLKSLKKGKTYKVYVRCYKTVGSKTCYSSYSTCKSVKVTK